MTNGTPDKQNTTGSGNGFLMLLVDGGDNMQPGVTVIKRVISSNTADAFYCVQKTSLLLLFKARFKALETKTNKAICSWTSNKYANMQMFCNSK